MRDYTLTQGQNRERTYAFAALRRLVMNWWKRRALQRLEDLDDHLLMDIGLTRAELLSAQRLPLDVDPIWEIMRERRVGPPAQGVRHK